MAIDPAKKALSLLDEFKAFALKGNVVDLAVGVVIGTAFGKIVTSLVTYIFTPAINLVIKVILGKEKLDFADWKWNGIEYGLFINDVISFLIIAMALFIFIVKFLGFIMKSKKAEAVAPPAPPAPPAPTKEQELLSEIRDLLKAKA
jgi:large conductance mechanosensitive channel